MSRRSSTDGAGLILLIGAIAGFFWSLFKYPVATLIGVNILTLIFFPDSFGTIFGISFVVGLIYYFAKQSNKKVEEIKVNQKVIEKYGTNIPDKSKPLLERNQDIIQEFYNGIRKDSWPHYVENKTSDCLKEIAEREGQSVLAPKSREWLPVWEKRAGIPQEWLNLKIHILDRFKKRYQDILTKEEKARERKNEDILEGSKDLIEKFLEIAERKVSIIDDYGDENWDALPKEIENCITKINNKYSSVGYDYSLQHFLEEELEKKFRSYHKSRKNKRVSTINLNGLSGVEFETHTAHILTDNGFDVRGTPATGDQGADLIAKKDGKTIIIQAKRYQGTVGNKAVQEVIGAVQFYSGDEGWVITNSTFTPSAKNLAHKSGVKLIDGHMLNNIKEYIN